MLVWKAFDFSIKSEQESYWVKYSWCRFLPFIILNISCHSLLLKGIFVEFLLRNQLIILWEFPCMLPFSPLLFNILSLFLISVSLITLCLGVFLLRFILPGTLHFLDWLTISFPILGKFSTKTISSNIFLDPFSLSSPSETTIMWMLMHLMSSQRTLRLTSVFSFFLFFYILFYSSDLHILSSRSLICSSASVILLLIASSVMFISLLFVL